jgi:glutamate dehydrogenase
VHRPVHLDTIMVTRLSARGRVVGQRLFVGLFTSSAYYRSVRNIPMLRRRLAKALELAGFPKTSHDGKALGNILENFPRDELFQVSDEHLFNTALGILHLQERQRVALFVRRDDFERFVSCLVYVPRDHYTTDLRRRMQGILEDSFAGTVSANYSQLGDSPLARLHVIIRTTPGQIPDYDAHEIEARLVDATRSWADHLRDALVVAEGEEKGLRLFRRYGQAFRSGYRERFNAASAVADIAVIEAASEAGELGMSLYRPIEAPDDHLWFKVYHPGGPIPLSDVLPMLEHMGLRVMDEIPYPVWLRRGTTNKEPSDSGRRNHATTWAETPAAQTLESRKSGQRDRVVEFLPDEETKGLVMIHDFGLQTHDGSNVDLGAVREKFQDTFHRVWRAEIESDGFNTLVLRAGLAWREVVILRAYRKYLRQAGTAFSQAYMEQTLSNNPALTRHIVALFKGMDAVESADEDRILRRLVNLVDSTLRTNYFQRDASGKPKTYVSFKLNSQAIEDLPLPRPMVEIWVYSPDVEGVHLRFGKVARGGLRWSDRREDFRTEILGLVKAQQVKNAVIVPVGSKGGFVVKRPPPTADREAFLNQGIACYRTLISGLLDITDDLAGDKVVPPDDVVRGDADDTYLVVAADKGTATFSDIANSVADSYGFWLGDAFASGGSYGYDHKKMGITARGGWESVKRHFRELGKDIQAEDFTVVGVGDMSGDVFGNGMLLSPHIRMIGAFNHMHVFVDPDPDPEASFAERKRLFEKPRSTWADYDEKLISKGGGVFERKAKTIKLTPQIKRRFNIIRDTVTPNHLVKALLAADVDLLWFGGIGTYLKADDESHADAGDRANDQVRVDAPELRCKVIGEGANLGATQRGRIQFALGGGRLNTDSIDNSAGVDCSDHEVNIKILLDSLVGAGDLTFKQRNNLLARMTDEVAELVLRDNYLQTQAISMVQTHATHVLDSQWRLMRMLERTGRLDRAVEFLPDDETLAERTQAKMGLTRPEIAILISYAEIWLYDELLKSDLPDDPYLAEDLVRYFPSALQKKHRKAIDRHRLRREIIATRVTNSMINRVGGFFVTEFMEKTGMAPPDIARAYTIAREIFRLRDLWDRVEGLDNKVPARTQTAMLMDINHLIEWATLWFLRNGSRPLEVGANIAEFADGIRELADGLSGVLPHHYSEDMRDRARPYLEDGVPEDLAMTVADLVNLFSAPDMVRLGAARKLPVLDVARLYFAVGTRFHLGRLRAATDVLESLTHWQKLAAAALIEEIFGHQLALTSQVMDQASDLGDPATAIDQWSARNRAAVERTDQLLSELWTGEVNDLSMVAVASRQLRALAETPPGG